MIKEGQKVRVVGNVSWHKFEIGEVIIVKRIEFVKDGVVTSFVGDNGQDTWWLSEKEVEPVE